MATQTLCECTAPICPLSRWTIARRGPRSGMWMGLAPLMSHAVDVVGEVLLVLREVREEARNRGHVGRRTGRERLQVLENVRMGESSVARVTETPPAPS
jgi:hypothetical protein